MTESFSKGERTEGEARVHTVEQHVRRILPAYGQIDRTEFDSYDRAEDTQKAAFNAKLAKNKASGHKAFASGAIEGFKGYTHESMGNIYEFKLELAPSTQKEILERTVEPLKNISERHDIEQFYPYDGELAPHVTLEVAKFQGVTEEQKTALLKELNDNTRLAIISNVLRGLDFTFDTVVAGGRDTYLCVGEFGIDLSALHKARRIIAGTMAKTVKIDSLGEAHGLIMPINYQDIVHTTIGRMDKAPQDVPALLAYAADVEKEIGVPLREKPIEVMIDNVYHGSALAYHIAHNSPQLKP